MNSKNQKEIQRRAATKLSRRWALKTLGTGVAGLTVGLHQLRGAVPFSMLKRSFEQSLKATRLGAPERKFLKYRNPTTPDADLITRMPGWLADESVDQGQDTLGRRPQHVFPEEALFAEMKKVGGKDVPHFYPFQPVMDGVDLDPQLDVTGNPIATHLMGEIAGYRKVFGEPFLLKDASGKPRAAITPFEKFIVGLLQRISRHNASKYWLRAVHLKSRDQIGEMEKIPVQSGGFPRDPAFIPTDAVGYKKAVEDAEADFAACTNDIRAYIQDQPAILSPETTTNPGKAEAAVDMMMCNDYIISCRIVWGRDIYEQPEQEEEPEQDAATANPGDINVRILAPEIAGSSSSYIYVSSPYSSYSG